ncbi:ABC transporter permease [Kiritimatiellota bacterium B12222]|nr:ABC transporter permease [Kiritimatiellota bacterium B12222]
MNPLTDILNGWKARPLPVASLMMLCLMLSLLTGSELWMLEKASSEADTLLQAWPQDASTLLLPAQPNPEKLIELTQRLPAGSWYGLRINASTAWVTGTLPPDFFTGQGNGFSPQDLHAGEMAVYLSAYAYPQQIPGGLFPFENQAFRIYGVGQFPLSVDKVIPLRSQTASIAELQQLKIALPASTVEPLIKEFLQWQNIQLIDHREKQQLAQAGFQKLKRILTGITIAVALLIAVLLQALYQAELRERKTEFALRRALGATPQNIRNQILGEALLGSVLPCLLGYLFFLPLVPLAPLLSAMILAPAWILFCATLPAMQAAKLIPSEALKGE